PAALDPSSGAVSAQASFDIPLTQPVGELTDTASVTWRDANANPYGPVSARFTTSVTSSGAGATLVLAPAKAGPNVTGTSQQLTVTARDTNGVPIAGLAVHLAVTGANATSADAPTDASGSATFTYLGANRGDDTAQGNATYRGSPLTSNTSTISWVTPIQTATTTTVLAQFIASNGSRVFNTPKTATPAFSQIVPTINFFSADGFVVGIATGATRVSGAMVNVPTGGITEFQCYTVVGSYNQPTAPVRNTIVVHFPAAGSYPYEVDYSECCAGELALTMTQGSGANPTGVPPTGSLSLTPINVFGKPVG